jgi:hypothetical protein
MHDRIGCLNAMCCDEAKYFVKSKYDYLVYFSILLVVLGFANYILLIVLFTHLQMFSVKRLKHEKEEKALGIIKILALVVGVFYAIVNPTAHPTFMPNIHLNATAVVA